METAQNDHDILYVMLRKRKRHLEAISAQHVVRKLENCVNSYIPKPRLQSGSGWGLGRTVL